MSSINDCPNCGKDLQVCSCLVGNHGTPKYKGTTSKIEPDAFMKFDTKKNRLELIDYNYVEGIGEILTFGAEKYAAWNWQKASSNADRERLVGAMMRHAMAYARGEKLDPESGKSHLYHMGCCQMFLDYFDRNDTTEYDEYIERIMCASN